MNKLITFGFLCSLTLQITSTRNLQSVPAPPPIIPYPPVIPIENNFFDENQQKIRPIVLGFDLSNVVQTSFSTTQALYFTEAMAQLPVIIADIIKVTNNNEVLYIPDEITTTNTLGQKMFGTLSIPNGLTGTKLNPASSPVTGVDLLIFVQSHLSTSSPIMGLFDSQCLAQSDVNSRPVVGYINIAYDLIDSSSYEIFLKQFIASIFRVMGIDRRVINTYVGSTSTIFEDFQFYHQINTTFLHSPKLLTYARDFFNCPSMIGIPLRNLTSWSTQQMVSNMDSIYFDKSIFPEEIMAGGRYISAFTLKLLEDSGWYFVNYQRGDYYNYLKNAGCGIFSTLPTAHPPGYQNLNGCFHDDDTAGPLLSNLVMTPLFDQIANCALTFNLPKLPFVQTLGETNPANTQILDCRDATNAANPSLGQVFGVSSAAFFSNVGNPQPAAASEPGFRCHQYLCHPQWKNTIIITIDTQQVLCTEADIGSTKTVVAPFSGTITCPDVIEFCKIDAFQRCPNDCHGNGSCIRRKCYCRTGTGLDCQ